MKIPSADEIIVSAPSAGGYNAVATPNVGAGYGALSEGLGDVASAAGAFATRAAEDSALEEETRARGEVRGLVADYEKNKKGKAAVDGMAELTARITKAWEPKGDLMPGAGRLYARRSGPAKEATAGRLLSYAAQQMDAHEVATYEGSLRGFETDIVQSPQTADVVVNQASDVIAVMAERKGFSEGTPERKAFEQEQFGRLQEQKIKGLLTLNMTQDANNAFKDAKAAGQLTPAQVERLQGSVKRSTDFALANDLATEAASMPPTEADKFLRDKAATPEVFNSASALLGGITQAKKAGDEQTKGNFLGEYATLAQKLGSDGAAAAKMLPMVDDLPEQVRAPVRDYLQAQQRLTQAAAKQRDEDLFFSRAGQERRARIYSDPAFGQMTDAQITMEMPVIGRMGVAKALADRDDFIKAAKNSWALPAATLHTLAVEVKLDPQAKPRTAEGIAYRKWADEVQTAFVARAAANKNRLMTQDDVNAVVRQGSATVAKQDGFAWFADTGLTVRDLREGKVPSDIKTTAGTKNVDIPGVWQAEYILKYNKKFGAGAFPSQKVMIEDYKTQKGL